MRNKTIKDALKSAGMKQWQLADLLGMPEGSLCRKLRYELPEEEQLAIVKRIEEAKHE